MKNYKETIRTTLVLTLAFFFIGGSIPLVSNVSANNIEELEQKEQEREEEFLSQLLLEIPEQTDNPSHIITFVDPSETSAGVELEIDEKGFEEITSPYALPALGIGEHQLRFRFVDNYGSTQIIEREIIIIPRPPIINSPSFEDEFLQLSGTGLANSDLVLILSSDRDIITKEAEIDGDSNWQIQIPNDELREGVFTFSAFTRRYGYASDLAEAITFEIGESNSLTVNEEATEIYFSFDDISMENVGKILSTNIDLGLLIGASFLLGFLISLLFFSVVKRSSENRTVRVFEKKIKKGEKKELTLKERLSQQAEAEKGSGKKKEEKQAEKKEKKKEKKEEKKKGKTEQILTKVDFLKDYKKFDPDDEQGEEKDNIEVKVTSKK